jgi:excisionase family DNA binding protein
MTSTKIPPGPVQAVPIAVPPGEAARIAGVGRTTIYSAIGSGELRSLKVGKRRLIEVEALRAWLHAHEVCP